MDGRDALILVHILLLVYWLGADLGQFVLSFWVTRPSLSVDARASMARVMALLDVGPRVALVLMLPVGLELARGVGYIALAPPAMGAIWAAAWIWLVIVVRLHLAPATRYRAARTVDLAFRSALSTGLVSVGFASLATGSPVRADWLAIKVIIFGLLVALGIGIRIAITPFGRAFGQILTQGSTPEEENVLSASLRRARPMVVAIWVGLIVAAALGVGKP